MNEFKEARESYESTPIPEELTDCVRAGIRQGRANRRRRGFRRGVGTVAACLVVLVGMLNVSPAVAAAAADVPVLGGLFRVLTVRDYEMEEDQAHYQVTVPEIQAEGKLPEKVNQEIQAIVDSHIAEQQTMWEEYHKSFLETGGTEEEWAERSMDVVVDYQIMSRTDTTVSFVVDLSQCSYNASETQYYYNLDLENDRTITLEDLLGENWVATCNAAVQTMIENSVDEDGFSYFFAPEEGGFTTVDEATSFYIREDGVPVLVFPKYSIAAGAAGIVEVPVELG